MLVYLITNKINGKQYVGQHAGLDLEVYWRRNVWLALNNYQGKRLLYRAIRKYGEGNFEIVPLVIVKSKKEMDKYEIGLIAHLDLCNPEKGYNLTQGGGGSFGFKPDEETRQKMSKSHIGLKMPESHSRKLSERNKGNKYAFGKKMTEEHCQALIKINTGAKRSEDTRRKLSESHKGKILSEETKQRISESQKGRIFSEETKQKMSSAQKGNQNRLGDTKSVEERKKISESLRGNKNAAGAVRTPEYCRQKSESQMGRKFSEETRRKMSIAAKNRHNKGTQ